MSVHAPPTLSIIFSEYSMIIKRMGSFGGLEEDASSVRNLRRKLLPTGLLLVFLGVAITLSLISFYSSQYLKVPTTNETRILPSEPPPNLFHGMNDTELFSRAMSVHARKEDSFSPKIAFMFLTRGPLPLSPLWDKFFKGNNKKLYSIYIHSFPDYKPDFSPSSVFHNRQIPSQVTDWGTMSVCDAERRLIGNSLLDPSNEWFILLSEACIPLHNFTIVYHYISRSHLSFIGAVDDPAPEARGRYDYYMWPVINITNWRKGYQWFEINRNLALDIIQDSVYYPVFKEFCLPDYCFVDEHYFQTMLTIQSPHMLANRSLTWVDWSMGGAHPYTFDHEDDIDEWLFKDLMYTQNCSYNNHNTSMCYLFARKFAPTALDSLLGNSSLFFGF